MKKSEYYFALNVNDVKNRLEKYPPIGMTHVDKIFPNTLKIKVWVRQALGCFIYKQDTSDIPLLFDENGMIFKIGQGEMGWDMPIITGLSNEDMRIGKLFPKNLMNLLDDLHGLRESNSSIFKIISEIEVIPRGQRDFEFGLYLVPYRTRLRLGKRINSADLKYALMMLDIISRQGIDSPDHEIDFRTQQIVYRFKEGEV